MIHPENSRHEARGLLGREWKESFMLMNSDYDWPETLVTFLGKVTEKFINSFPKLFLKDLVPLLLLLGRKQQQC